MIPSRRVLDRIYGFATPTPRDGRVTYECLYCGAWDDDGTPLHSIDCFSWAAAPAFATLAAAQPVDRAGGDR